MKKLLPKMKKSGKLSRRALFEISVAALIFCIAVISSIPQLLSDIERKKNMVVEESVVIPPEERGLDPGLLEKAGSAAGNTDAVSLVISRRGDIVYERYYSGQEAENYNNVFSVTKSVISALIGIAVEEGYIKGIDEKLLEFFPEELQEEQRKDKREITIEQLLTMTPGFCENLNQWEKSPDFVGYTLDLPLSFLPGEKFQYANSSAHLLSALLSKATGMSTREFADRYLFGPMGIEIKKWDTDPQGYHLGYSNLFLKPRDMVKFGELYKNRGKWEGKQLVPEAWVLDSTRKHVSTHEAERDHPRKGYGYQWWTAEAGGHPLFYASGMGGQYIFVIEELDLVVVTTTRPDGQLGEIWWDILTEYIIPAVRD